MTDGTFILTDSEYLPIPRGTGRSSELGDRVVLALFDGGAFDIDERDGFVSSSVAVSGNFGEPTDSSSQEGGEGGGCAAAGSSPGALLLGIPVLVAAIRRKNEE
jgi:Synergist-CTERM protein sorting domain-containing protein